MDFWNRYYEICKRNWVTPNFVAKQLGISSGTVTWWKKGKIPYKSTVERIAKYFNVPIDYFYSSQGIEYQTNINNGTNNGSIGNSCNVEKNSNEQLTEFEQELIDLFRKLPTKEKNALLSKAYELAEKV